MTGQELTEEAKKFIEVVLDGHKDRLALIVLVEDGAEGMALVGSKSTTREEGRKELIAFLRHTLNVIEGN